ncbi:MAG: hypothetical protein JO176_15770 [Acidimicrobiia bacterium]|nr:hypothetical protein [Acidimicrobiia bacterium]
MIAALGVLATLGAACSSGSSGPTRPVAKPGQTVTVMSERDGGLRDAKQHGQYDLVAVAPGGGDLYVGSDLDQRLVKLPRRGHIETVLDCHSLFPEGTNEAKPRRGRACDTTGSGFTPKGLALAPDGTLYVVDGGSAVVWAVMPSGRVRRVAGKGNPLPVPAVVTGRARDVDVYDAGAIAVGPDGAVYFRDAGHVVKLGHDGMVTVVAGNGNSGDSGDGGPATQASITPIELAVDGAGLLYIGEGDRVRRVDAHGIITTVAGTPAKPQQFSDVLGLAVDGAGNLYVADNHTRVQRIERDGAVTTVASGLDTAEGLAVDAAGNLYIAEPAPADRVLMVGAAAH